MQTIGILGGMSYESTTHYYESINKKVNQALGKNNCANLRIISDNFQPIVNNMNQNQWDEIRDILIKNAMDLKSIGISKLVIATNTMHKLADVLMDAVGLPLIHIADCIAIQVREQGIHSIGLLGTKPTMTETFLKERLSQHGLEVCVPLENNEIEDVHNIIFQELCNGIVKENSKSRYVEIINNMQSRQNIQGVVLGCTEIGMLLSDGDVSIPMFDSAQCHIDEIVKQILNEELCDEELR